MMFLSIIMFVAQAASETVKQGPSSGQAITWTAVAMAIVANVGTWLVILKRNPKKATSNPGPAPAALANEAWEVIREHGEAIAGLVVSKDNTEKALVRIEGKVDRLLERKG
ncbi:MAG: hypothetical protein MUP28_05330 [Candidatus Aminicenantes bacterium]|nr:hypothetical protein [Candidatus Aminicenantes bacterium]